MKEGIMRDLDIRKEVKMTKGLAVFECQDDNLEMNRNAPDTI